MLFLKTIWLCSLYCFTYSHLHVLFQVVPDALTTISHYLDRLEQSLAGEGRHIFVF